MYIPRRIEASIFKALEQFPAILVTGPRQSGKTTLLKTALKGRYEYVSLDDPLEQQFADEDPNGFLGRFGSRPVILDEIQLAPSLLPYIKRRIDEHRDTPGRFALTGSQQFSLMENVSESLAGRAAVLDLLPFSFEEIEGVMSLSIADALWRGFFPDPLISASMRDLWMSSYFRTYVERDIRRMKSIKDFRSFEMFYQLLAALHGQTFNASTIGKQVGITSPTVTSWLGLLEAAYLVYALRPYFRNLGKRVVKTPKIYFSDPGLVTHATRQPSADACLAGHMGGSFFEGLVIMETVKQFVSRGRKPDIFFWRSHDGLEVDLLIEARGVVIPVEIKLTATPTLKHIEPMTQFQTLFKKDASDKGILVCRVENTVTLPHRVRAMSIFTYTKWLADLLDT